MAIWSTLLRLTRCAYIDDLLTLNNPDFSSMHRPNLPQELELKKTTESRDSCSYLYLNISVLKGKFCTNIYDKRDTFSFSIVNFTHMDSNIPSKPAYEVVISQLVRYLRICCNCQDFAYRSKLLTTRLLRQGYVYQKLCIEPTRPLCIAIPRPCRSTGGA